MTTTRRTFGKSRCDEIIGLIDGCLDEIDGADRGTGGGPASSRAFMSYRDELLTFSPRLGGFLVDWQRSH